MKLAIYSLKNILYQGDAASVNCRTETGEITVLDHHKPLITLLSHGVVKVLDAAKKEHYIPVRSGFMEVRSSNEARLLVEEDENAQ